MMSNQRKKNVVVGLSSRTPSQPPSSSLRFDNPLEHIQVGIMKVYVAVALMLCVSVAALAAFVWSGPAPIRHYTFDDLSELTCEELGERHTEVIDAYHDAEIAHYGRTAAFHADLGLPSDDVLPFAVLMMGFMRDNNISESKVVTRSTPWPLLYSDFYYEISGTCAANPSMRAVEAMRESALKLGLIGRDEMD